MGSRPHVGVARLGRFFDTFIGPREITFDLGGDFVGGSTVVRDLTLNVRMGPGVDMAIPAVLCYDLRDSGGELKICQLQAYWELPPMMLQFAGRGVAAVPAGARLMRALLANQGPAGSLGFLQAVRRPGRHARAVVNDLLAALSVGDELSTRRILGHGAPVGADLDELADRLQGAHPSKILAAGRSITVSLTAGRSDARGVVIVDFADGSAISRLRFFG